MNVRARRVAVPRVGERGSPVGTWEGLVRPKGLREQKRPRSGRQCCLLKEMLHRSRV